MSDAVLSELLADNRLSLNLPRLDAELQAECEWVTVVKPSLWKALAGTCGAEMVSLQTECIQASLVSASYIQMRLRRARELPWSLLGDNMLAKVEELRAGLKPQNIVGGKIWELLQLEVYDQAVFAGLWLLEQAAWEAAAVED